MRIHRLLPLMACLLALGLGSQPAFATCFLCYNWVFLTPEPMCPMPLMVAEDVECCFLANPGNPPTDKTMLRLTGDKIGAKIRGKGFRAKSEAGIQVTYSFNANGSISAQATGRVETTGSKEPLSRSDYGRWFVSGDQLSIEVNNAGGKEKHAFHLYSRINHGGVNPTRSNR